MEYAPGAGFSGAILLPALTVPEEFAVLERPGAELITF